MKVCSHLWLCREEKTGGDYLTHQSVCLSVCWSGYLSVFSARTCNHHTASQLAQLASADISWLGGIWKSPCWWTSHAAVLLRVRLSAYFGALVCVPIFHKHSPANVMQLSKAQPAKTHSAHKQLCRAKQMQKTLLDNEGGGQPSHMSTSGY